MARKTTSPNPIHASFFFFLRRLLPPLTVVLLCALPLSAATWYVKPSAEVPVRSGQGSDFKILAVVPDGMTVELLEEADPWARIRTPGGTEGWLLKRYLTSEPPPSSIVATLQAEKDRLEKTCTEISRTHNELTTTYAQSEQQLSICRAERDEALNTYETLRHDTADVIAIQKRLADATRELQETRTKLTALEQEKSKQQRNTSLLWFLAGGLVMLSGWFLGMMTARSRKRKTTLY